MTNTRNYLGLPLPPSIPTPWFIPFLDNLNGFNDSNIRCTILREIYKKMLLESGYKTTALDLAFKNFPIDFCYFIIIVILQEDGLRRTSSPL